MLTPPACPGTSVSAGATGHVERKGEALEAETWVQLLPPGPQ